MTSTLTDLSVLNSCVGPVDAHEVAAIVATSYAETLHPYDPVISILITL
jgi:hypothetical protein